MGTRNLLSALAIIIGGATSVGATQINQHGSAFQQFNVQTQWSTLAYYANGVQNLDSHTNVPVIAPVAHNPTPNASTVYIDGYNSSAASVGFTLYAYNDNGTYLGSVGSTSFTGSGQWELNLTIPAAINAYSWAYFSLYNANLVSGGIVTINGFGISA